MLKRITKEQLLPKIDLTVTSLGEPITFGVVFIAQPQAVIDAILKDENQGVEALLLAMVKEWDAEYPVTAAGVLEMEGERPGMTAAVIQAWYRARNAVLEKN